LGSGRERERNGMRREKLDVYAFNKRVQGRQDTFLKGIVRAEDVFLKSVMDHAKDVFIKGVLNWAGRV
jgi:hypothetical protein